MELYAANGPGKQDSSYGAKGGGLSVSQLKRPACDISHYPGTVLFRLLPSPHLANLIWRSGFQEVEEGVQLLYFPKMLPRSHRSYL